MALSSCVSCATQSNPSRQTERRFQWHRGESEDLRAEAVPLGGLVLNQVPEDRERAKHMEGCAGVETYLAADVRRRDLARVPGREFEDAATLLQGLNHRNRRRARSERARIRPGALVVSVMFDRALEANGSRGTFQYVKYHLRHMASSAACMPENARRKRISHGRTHR